MGQPVIVDNRPGASNNLGTDVLAKSLPDGYTIGIVGGSHNTNKFLFKNLGWDPEKSFEPIVYTHEVPLVFAIYPQLPAKTLPEFVAWMKATAPRGRRTTISPRSRPRNCCSGTKATKARQVRRWRLQRRFAAYPDLLAGRTALFIDSISAILPQVKAGNARAVAVSTRKRTKSLPEACRPRTSRGSRTTTPIRTAGSWRRPARPSRSSAKLNAEINAALKLPDVRTKLEAAGIEIQGGTPQEYAAVIKSDLAKGGKVVKEAGIRQSESGSGSGVSPSA